MNKAPTSLLSPASIALREVASEQPDQVALEIDEQQVSYRELNEQADRLAHRLVGDLGPGEHRVALRVNGTHALAVGFLAIQRAGLIAVGIDPTAPQERVREILEDVGAAMLLTDLPPDGRSDLPVTPRDLWALCAESEPVATDRERADLVSIVYTSGSTGRPKGIMMGNGQMAGLVRRQHDWGVEPGWRVGTMAAGTVAHAESIISCLLMLRGTLVAYEIRRHGVAPLGAWLQSANLDSCYMVPTILRHALPTLEAGTKLRSLKLMALSGETATWEDVSRLRGVLSEEAQILNTFGQSETGAIAALTISGDIPAGQGPLPAGRPFADMDVAIIGADGQPVPTGERGEIVVRSVSVALGYWRRPELTRATFTELGDGRREVRTGDEGRLLADGTLEHLGRLDHLVKISGNRVELGEVEAALVALNGVQAAAAAAFSADGEDTRLAACVVPQAGETLDPRVLRVHLARRLPGYMVPTRIAVAAALPQLSGGKVDRAAVACLPVLEPAGGDRTSAPAGSVEQGLAEIWCELLGLETVGRDDDFFALGGDSMRAARMFVEIERRLGIDRPVSLLAEAPTIAALAGLLSEPGSVWSAPLAIRTQGTRPPMFVLHDGVGSVLYARWLAGPLGADQPLYGIRCEALNGQPLAERSITELGARYVAQIQALYPDGPYVLYGASLGGLIALEVARQLLEAGAEIPLVVMGDSAPPQPRAERDLARYRRLRASLSPEQRRRYLLEETKVKLAWFLGEPGRRSRQEDRRVERALRRGEPVPAEVRGSWVMRELRAMYVSHQVRPPFPARTLLLCTFGPGQVVDLGWRELLGDSLKTVNVPLRHSDLSGQVGSAHVGPLIRAELDRLAIEVPTAVPAPVLV